MITKISNILTITEQKCTFSHVHILTCFNEKYS